MGLMTFWRFTFVPAKADWDSSVVDTVVDAADVVPFRVSLYSVWSAAIADDVMLLLEDVSSCVVLLCIVVWGASEGIVFWWVVVVDIMIDNLWFCEAPKTKEGRHVKQ